MNDSYIVNLKQTVTDIIIATSGYVQLLSGPFFKAVILLVIGYTIITTVGNLAVSKRAVEFCTFSFPARLYRGSNITTQDTEALGVIYVVSLAESKAGRNNGSSMQKKLVVSTILSYIKMSSTYYYYSNYGIQILINE